ncbi:MAG: hypothetical protein EA383_08135 [Spirochaetaceae bacterium]|nr:MAG: hypothetical protein EA383_08135 [Spirochaetaceae bacterium]
MRAIYVDAFGEGFRTADEIADLLSFAVDAELDSIVVQVVRRGDAFANRLPVPRADGDIPDPDFDPLHELCQESERHGIDIHAWVAVTPIAVLPPGERVSDTVDPSLQSLVSVCRDGRDREPNGVVHIDPGHPETAARCARIARALVREYPVAGVSLDRIRYPNAPEPDLLWGHNPVAMSRYIGCGGTVADAEQMSESFLQWRRDQVTGLLAYVRDEVHAERRSAEISVNAVCAEGLEHGWQFSRAYRVLGQDWAGWIRDGAVDRVLFMNYRGDSDDADLVPDDYTGDRQELLKEGSVSRVAERRVLQDRFQEWNALARSHTTSEPGDVGPRRRPAQAIPAIGLYLNTIEQTNDQLRLCRESGFRGFCGFSYRNPSLSALFGESSGIAERNRLAELYRNELRR